MSTPFTKIYFFLNMCLYKGLTFISKTIFRLSFISYLSSGSFSFSVFMLTGGGSGMSSGIAPSITWGQTDENTFLRIYITYISVAKKGNPASKAHNDLVCICKGIST